MPETLTVQGAFAEGQGHHYTIEDFATADELEQIEEANAKPRTKKFDVAASVSAEVLARFGFEAWKAWQNGDISVSDMNAYLSAERGRERELLLEGELVIQNMLAALVRKEKNKGVPAGVKNARDIIKKQRRIIEGN